MDADEEEKSKINSGFSKFLGLLQNTSGFLRKLSLAATETGDREEEELTVNNLENFWLYLRVKIYGKRWRTATLKGGHKRAEAAEADSSKLQDSNTGHVNQNDYDYEDM